MDFKFKYVNEEINTVFHQLGYRVLFATIKKMETFEERFFDIEAHFGDIVGMGVDFVEFCPNNEPPLLQDEILPWLWLVNPDIKVDIFSISNDTLREIMINY